MGFYIVIYMAIAVLLTGFYPATAATVAPGKPSILAENWLREANTRLGKTLPRNVSAEVPFRGPNGDLLFYAIQLAPEGFIIISANDLIEPVIAFSAAGTTNDLTEGNPLVGMLSQDMPDRNREAKLADTDYAAAQQQGTTPATPDPRKEHAKKNKAKWEKYAASAKTVPSGKIAAATLAPSASTTTTTDAASYESPASISDIRVAPILQSTWNQKTAPGGAACFNYYCPPNTNGYFNNYWAGCVATAMSQLMRYWQYPTSSIGQITANIKVDGVTRSATTLGGDGLGGAYDWNSMPLSPNASTPDDQRSAIGRLLADCGTVVNMSYTSTGSSAYLDDARDTLLSVFHYGNAKYRYVTGGLTKSEREAILFTNLSAGYPVFTGIRKASNNSGHAVITDGFGYISAVPYFHVNFGWGGSYDAWYNMPTFDSAPAYDIVDCLIYNIFPTGSGEILAGRIVDSLGTALPGASITVASASTNFSGITDASGYYGLRVLGGTTYTITASLPGYTATPLSNVTVNASATYYSTNANYWGANLTLTSTAEPIPTLGEWALIILTALIILFGAQSIRNQQVTT